MAVPQSMHGYFERALTDAQSAGQLRVRHIALVTLQEVFELLELRKLAEPGVFLRKRRLLAPAMPWPSVCHKLSGVKLCAGSKLYRVSAASSSREKSGSPPPLLIARLLVHSFTRKC